jgi:hypothetical protein
MFFHLLFPETKSALDPVSTPMVLERVTSVSGQLSVRRHYVWRASRRELFVIQRPEAERMADRDEATPNGYLEPVLLIFLPGRLSPGINGCFVTKQDCLLS